MVLKTKMRERLGVADLARGGLAVVGRGSGAHRAALGCRGHVVHDEVEHFVGADVAQARSEEHGKDLVLANGVVQTGDNVLFVDGAFVEELFHQRVIAFGHQFYQPLVRGFGLLGKIVGNGADLGFAVAAHLVGVGLHLHQIDHAGEALLGADGQLHRNHGASEGRGQRLHHAIEVGALAIHAGADDDAGQRQLVAIIPDALGDHFHAADRIDHHQSGFHGGQRHLGFVNEHVEARRVDEVDLGFAPLDDGGRRGKRHGARDLFFFVVGGGVAFINPAQALG